MMARSSAQQRFGGRSHADPESEIVATTVLGKLRRDPVRMNASQ